MLALAPEAVIGIVSLIFWSLIVIISIKYAILIMRASNHGEGGILALLALVSRHRAKSNRRRALMVVETSAYLVPPQWSPYGRFVLATAATVIASQSIISGAFSLTSQAIQLGFLPRMNI